MRRLLGFVAALALVATGSLAVASAQEGTPTLTLESTLPATLQDTDGLTVAVALLAEGDDGEVRVGVLAMGLTSGEHGMHVHETGVCDPTGDPAFTSPVGTTTPPTTSTAITPATWATSPSKTTGPARWRIRPTTSTSTSSWTRMARRS